MPKGPRKHVCPSCPKAYSKAEHLIRHKRTHTGEQPFTCAECHRSFSRQDSLARHQQRQGHDAIPSASPHINSTATSDANNRTNSMSLGGDDNNLQNGQSVLEDVPQAIHGNQPDATAHLQTFGNDLTQYQTDDLFLQLTWPDSEELLQSILTSNLVPWSENIELLPSQYLLNDTRLLHNIESPWLTQEDSSNQQPESGNHAIRNVSQIISELSANVTSEAESAALSTIFLDACLHMFFDQFISNFPVCHRPTFVFRDWTHPLLLNSIALGSLFIGQEVNIAKGEILWRLAHTAVATSWHSLILHRAPSDPCNGVQLILTALLGQTYAMLSSTARLRSTAQIFHSLGFYWARQCDMFSFQRKFNPEDVMTAGTREQKLEMWKMWAAEEVELRALLGHYILDGQLSYLTGAPTCQRHASNPLPLPCSEALFQALTLDEWTVRLQQENIEATSFRQLLLSLFTGSTGVLNQHHCLSLLTTKVVIEGVQSFVSEANSVDGIVVGSPSNTSISTALGSLYSYFTGTSHFTAGEKNELLLRWHVVGIDAAVSLNSLCRSLCSQYSIDQNVFGLAKSDQKCIDLKKWTESFRARRALLHAFAIWDALAHLPQGQAHAVHVPMSIFTAATIYCAFVLTGTTAVMFPQVVNWDAAMHVDLDDRADIQQCDDHLLKDYLLCFATIGSCGQPKNLLYDCNIFLLRLRQIRRPWGICASFESIIEQWLSRCGI